jgi:hypothetical protein
MRSVPFSIRRRFVALPADVADALHDRAFARATRALKMFAGVMGAILFALCLAITTSDTPAGEVRDLPVQVVTAIGIAALGYAVTMLSLSQCVLRHASGAVLRSFAASVESDHAVRP